MPLGVIFDMDGVLVDSAAAHRQSWVVLAERHGLRLPPDVFQRTFGQSGRDIVRLMWGGRLGPEEVDQLVDEKEAIYRDLVRGRMPFREGAAETVRRLYERGYLLAVGTSGPPENVELMLAEGGLEPYFTAVVHGLEVERGKPAPDIFLVAAGRLGVAPECALVVEDAPVGIEAARRAGMAAAAVTGTHPREALQAAGAAVVVDRLPDLPDPAEILARVSGSGGSATSPPGLEQGER